MLDSWSRTQIECGKDAGTEDQDQSNRNRLCMLFRDAIDGYQNAADRQAGCGRKGEFSQGSFSARDFQSQLGRAGHGVYSPEGSRCRESDDCDQDKSFVGMYLLNISA